MGYNLLANGVYWGYNPFTNRLQTSWDIQIVILFQFFVVFRVQGFVGMFLLSVA